MYIDLSPLDLDQQHLTVALDSSAQALVKIPREAFGFYPELISASNSAFAGIDLRVPMILVVLYLTALFWFRLFRSGNIRRKRAKLCAHGNLLESCLLGRVDVSRPQRFSGRLECSGQVASQAVSARSEAQMPRGMTIPVQGDQLLAMGTGELIMLVLAMVLTVLADSDLD